MYNHVIYSMVNWPNFDSLLVEPPPVVSDTCTTSKHQGMHYIDYTYIALTPLSDHNGKLQSLNVSLHT